MGEPPRLLEVLVELEALLELLVKEEVASAEVGVRLWGSAWPPQEPEFAVSPVAAAVRRPFPVRPASSLPSASG